MRSKQSLGIGYSNSVFLISEVLFVLNVGSVGTLQLV